MSDNQLDVTRLSEADLVALSMAKLRQANAELTYKNASMEYNHFIYQLSIKYSLIEGDIIEENGNIQRHK